MQIARILVIIACTLILYSCNSSSKTDEPVSAPVTKPQHPDTAKFAFIPVTDFIEDQLNELRKEPVTPLRTISKSGIIDSSWLKNTEVAKYAGDFLSPKIDSAAMSKHFKETSFHDQTINAVTFTYEPIAELPDSMSLQKWDVYMHPESSEIQRVYLVKKTRSNNKTYMKQLTWKTGAYFKIMHITEEPGKTPQIQEEQVTWKFD